MPDVSIMIELCDILSINVNELLSGERLSEENYREKANENIVSMIKVADENRKTKNKRILLFITIISIFIICRLAIGIYQSIEVGVNYDERIVQCEITENEITYKVNGLSIIHTEREIVICFLGGIMKKKTLIIIGIVIGIVFTLLVAFFIGTGLTKNPKVEIISYSLSKDGSELNFTIGIPDSIGYTRGYKNKGGGVKSHYLNFYNTFGVINSNWGAKFEFTLELDEDDTEVYFNRAGGGYELVLQKNEITGEWERPNKTNN